MIKTKMIIKDVNQIVKELYKDGIVKEDQW